MMTFLSDRDVVPMVLRAVCTAAIGLSFTLLAATPGATQDQGANWPAYLGGPTHSSYNAAATAITRSNAADLQMAWSFSASEGRDGGSKKFWASPVVVDGVIYIGSENGDFYAIDESTQSVIWQRFLGLVTPTTCSGSLGVTSTATVSDDPSGDLAVYVNAPNGYFYALDASTGSTIWKSLVGKPSTKENNYYAWGSPAVANDTVYIGISSNCDTPLVPAGLLAFDQSTGKKIAEWHSLPAGDLGGSIWSAPAVLSDGSVIVTTGNAQGKAQPGYAESFVRLNGTTLQPSAHWKVPADQRVDNSDFGGSPTLFTADLDGVETPMVGACNKNGIYYALEQDDLDAGPVWSHRMGAPYGKGGLCISAAIWDGTQLIEGGGSSTTIDGVKYQGSVQSLDPATGTPVWQRGLPGEVFGSPMEDGAGVIAVPIFYSTTGDSGVYLLSASNGRILSHFTSSAGVFGQPVFVGSDLLVAGPDHSVEVFDAH